MCIEQLWQAYYVVVFFEESQTVTKERVRNRPDRLGAGPIRIIQGKHAMKHDYGKAAAIAPVMISWRDTATVQDCFHKRTHDLSGSAGESQQTIASSNQLTDYLRSL